MSVLYIFLIYRIKKVVCVLGVSKSSMHISYYAATLFLMSTLCFIDDVSSNGKITFKLLCIVLLCIIYNEEKPNILMNPLK